MTWMNATGRPPLLLRIDARKRRNGANAALPIMANDMARHGRHRRPRETSTGAWQLDRNILPNGIADKLILTIG